MTGLSFYNCDGSKVGAVVGTPKGNGASGETKEEFIGLLPNEKIVGVKIQHARDPNDGGADMIGRISFILSAPA